MFVKPASPGLVMYDPDTMRRLPDEGAEVPETSFWIRRERGGDVVRVKPAAAPTPSKKTKAEETR